MSAPYRPLLAAALVSTLLAASGCAPLAVGAVGAAGVAMVQERSVGDAIDDAAIGIRVRDLWFQHAPELVTQLELKVVEGRVLITGSVPSPELRVEAVRLAWQVGGVREVINEIQIAQGGGIGDYARDAWISTQLRTKILFDRDVASVNYNTETVGGVVYLMGIARDQAELNRVIGYAREIPYVVRVVSYVRLRDELPGIHTPAAAGSSSGTTAPAESGTPMPVATPSSPVTSSPLPPPP